MFAYFPVMSSKKKKKIYIKTLCEKSDVKEKKNINNIISIIATSTFPDNSRG